MNLYLKFTTLCYSQRQDEVRIVRTMHTQLRIERQLLSSQAAAVGNNLLDSTVRTSVRAPFVRRHQSQNVLTSRGRVRIGFRSACQRFPK